MEPGGTPAAPGGEAAERPEAVIPGFKDADAFVKHALGTVVAATKASNGLPQPGDEFDFYRSFPSFQGFCDTQGDRLLHCMSQVMRYHGCRGHLRDRSHVTELEDKFDLLVDANDAILERVGILLDEAAGVNKTQKPVLPSGSQPPRTIVSSWNRKASEASRQAKRETFHLLHAKNIPRPQFQFREKVDNSNTPFVPKIFVKPNALKPLPEVLSKSRHGRKKRPEDLDVPPALADFLHQQRTQQTEQDMFAHPYLYELERFSPPAELLEKPRVQMFRPLAETPCRFVSTLDDLVALNEKLSTCKEFAVDVEHHSYRSFLGLTCLLQISTRTEDFIVDALALRSDLFVLNETFTDPAVVKVLHGADSDVEWLQRDLGLYLVNLFDTHQAARMLNLGRNSLDHLLKLYCGVDADKQYQLADWRIRPLPEEMVRYAREDTHYLLYIYDRVREGLWEQVGGQPALLQAAWQRGTAICSKKYVKPIFTEDSYLELYRKQKKLLNTQQLAAFRLLFAWRDKMARQEDESTGYVLPNHMLLRVAEELPKEPQGIVACCNPVPPLVRQQINELHLLIRQAREMPLLKTEAAAGAKKKGPLPNQEKPESHLFGPHDNSHVPLDEKPHLSPPAPAPTLGHAALFPEAESEPERGASCLPGPPSLLLRASISIFNDHDGDVGEELTPTQRKARRIMESFENPFRMYLPPQQNLAHVSQAAKSDPSSKIYEISNRWKLLSQVQLETETKKGTAKAKVQKTAAREAAEKRNKEEAAQTVAVRQMVSLERTAGHKREKEGTDPRTETPKQEGKKAKASRGDEESEAASKPFTPFDYSKSNLREFAESGKPKASSQFDPSKQFYTGKKGASKAQHPSGIKSATFTAGKSSRGFRHNWPKR